MDAIIISDTENDHPLSWMLDKDHRHVWCAIKSRGYWISYNWHQGVPHLIAECGDDFDLAAHYRAQGYNVHEMQRGDRPCHGPLILNNCVSHVMVVCGIRAHFIFTPKQLWRHVTGGKDMRQTIRGFLSRSAYFPGFGSSSRAAPPPPPVQKAPKSAMAVAADKTLAAQRASTAAAKKRAAAAAPASSTLLDDDDGVPGMLK
jgi:hypothetical protein